jgi:hypothetical protein
MRFQPIMRKIAWLIILGAHLFAPVVAELGHDHGVPLALSGSADHSSVSLGAKNDCSACIFLRANVGQIHETATAVCNLPCINLLLFTSSPEYAVAERFASPRGPPLS